MVVFEFRSSMASEDGVLVQKSSLAANRSTVAANPFARLRNYVRQWGALNSVLS